MRTLNDAILGLGHSLKVGISLLSQCVAKFAQVTIIRFDEQTLSSISTLQVQLLQHLCGSSKNINTIQNLVE